MRASGYSFGFLALALVMGLTATGCSTIRTAPERGSESIETASVLPVPAGRGSREESGLVLAYEFITPTGESLGEDGTCRLRWLETTSRRSIFMAIDRTKKAAYVALPPGKWETGRMGCSITHVWDLGQILHGPIKVEAGSASYAGKVSFVFQNKNLSVVEKASRKQHADGYAAAAALVPAGQRVINGYNLLPLNEEMASQGSTSSGFDLQAKGVPTGPVLTGLLNKLRACEPAAKDPLRFGKLDYTAVYAKGRFASFQDRRDVNAFNEQFRSCVSETLSAFRPPATGPVEIHLIY